jgi:AraC-like DNA-binding protein
MSFKEKFELASKNFARSIRILRRCGLSPGSISEVFPATVLQPLFDELTQVGLQMRREDSDLHVKLLECPALRIAGCHAPVAATTSHASMTFQRCRQYIEKNGPHLAGLDQIADQCHLDKACLRRLFQRYDIKSPCQYLLQLKMRHAAERLREPAVLAKQVAEELGFADQFHFSRVFHSFFGLSSVALRGLHVRRSREDANR